MNRIADDILIHYGVGKLDGAPGRGSGRYPLGSGENPNQRSGDFVSRVQKMKKDGLSEKEIADQMGLTTTQLRVQLSLAKDERRSIQVATAKRLREEGHSLNEIAKEMGFANDSSVRSLLNENSEIRMNQARKTADFLREQIETRGMIDVGAGVERELGLTSREKLKEAITILEMEGYPVYNRRLSQATNPGKFTTLQIICPKGTEYKEIYNTGSINSVRDYVSHDGGETFKPKFVYPASMDSSRLQICYAEDGGIDKDGVMEIRRGVKDLSLGESHYAQVRILVDDTKYLKGMAIYSDDLPDGVDIRFNTNKKKGTPVADVLKNIKDDPDNPFGALIKENGGQSYYIDDDGKEKLSLINKTREEGDWNNWSDRLPSQFLSKQSQKLIDKQLTLTLQDKTNEYNEICSLNNPTVKKVLLSSFADDCDSAAVHLQAASLPRQKYQVILPITSLKDTEVYAPNYNNGETVALIRYPHGGTFEIPILTVNNKHAEAKKVLGNAKDAIGINSNVAARLSGADFDGDTVMVIPCNSENSKVKITSTSTLRGLEGFDPKLEYGTEKRDDGYYNSSGQKIKVMNNTQTEMGKISNLITDMTLLGAKPEELAQAVRHSMSILKGDYIAPHVSIWWYRLDSIDEVGNPDMWLKANPNLGKTVTYSTYQKDVERAEKSPAAKNDILAKRFGLPMEGYTYYFTYEETLPHRRRSFWSMPCSLGADLSQGDDFCAFTFLFPLSNGAFGVKTRNYITELTLTKLPAAMRIKYNQFIEEGSLIVLEGTVLDIMQVYENLDEHISDSGYDVRAFGFDPYNAKEFVERWQVENGPYGIEKVPQGSKTESVPLGELKKLAEERMLIFDEELMTFAMGNCITLEDTNGNRKLYKKRREQKIDAVAAMMDAYIAYKLNRDAFE